LSELDRFNGAIGGLDSRGLSGGSHFDECAGDHACGRNPCLRINEAVGQH
jgi:hypothetical protein